MSRLATDLLAVDIGNTKIAATLVEGGSIRARARLDREADAATHWMQAWDAAVAGMVTLCGTRIPILVASVAPVRTPAVVRGLRHHGLRHLHVVRASDPWPFDLDVHDPHTVGVDRLAHVAGLAARGMRRAVAVGAGTAVIIDVLRDGRFVGGCISPGVDLAARALQQGTEQLPRVRVTGAVPLRGRETRAAIESGVLHGTVYGAAGIAQRFARELGSGTPIVVTGGLAGPLAAALRGPVEVDPDLLVRGLRALQVRLAGPK
jgi:type III pantothenate kinase